MSLALLGERLPATTAAQWGLVYRVVEPEQLGPALDDLTTRLSRAAPLALTETKQAVNAATLGDLEDSLDRELAGQSALLESADFHTAVTAFAQKRTPDFVGR